MLLVGMLFIPALLLSQTVAWKFPITVVDNANNAVSVVWLGVHPSATGCANSATKYVFGTCDTVVENFLPPIFIGVMDARFLPKKAGDDCLDQGTDKLIKPYIASTDIDTATLGVTATNPNSDPFTISWPAGLSAFATSIIIKDGINATYTANMTTATSLVVDDGTFTKFRIIITGPKSVSLLPSPPVLTTPVNNATDQDSTLTLTWAADANSKTYHLQVAYNDINFSPENLIFDADTSATSVTIHRMKGNRLYYWQVRGQNAFFTGCYSTPFVFKTAGVKPEIPIPKNPAAGAINVSPSTKFSWTSVFADSFELQVSSNNFSSVLIDTVLTDTNLTVPLKNCITYSWKIQAKNGTKLSGFSPVRSFTTQPAVPSPPILTLPVDNGTVSIAQPTLTWTGDPCSNTYHVQLALDAGFSTIILDQAVAQTSIQTQTLFGQTDYYWHVNAINATAGTSAFAATRKFTTGVFPPTVPNLISPSSGSTNVSVTPTLVWSKSFNIPTSYHLQVDTSSKFTTPFVNDSSITDTAKTLALLQNCSQYYWRVSAKNTAGTTAYTAAFAFSTPILIPDTPTPLTPANFDTVKTVQVTLNWTSTDICSKRFVLILTTDTTSATVIRHDTLSVVSDQVGPLGGETKYFWKVASINSKSQLSPYTSWQQFITGPFLPSTPSLVSPADGITLGTNTVTLNWNTSSNKARRYRLQISLVNTFATLVYDNATLTDTTVSIDTLKHCDQYFWRVSATNPAGTTAFSAIRSFNSEIAVPLPPAPVAPANLDTVKTAQITISWASTDLCSERYIMILSVDTASAAVLRHDTVSVGSDQVGPLGGETKYFWKVASINSLSQVGTYTPWQQFITGPFLPGTPNLVSPGDGLTLGTNTVTLNWNTPSNKARTYRLQISLVSTFASLVYENASLTDTTVSIDTLKHCDQYFWRVSATNPAGTTAFSTIRSFNSEISIPLTPAPVAPANLDTVKTAQVTITWAATDLCSERFILVLTTDTTSAAVLRHDTLSGVSEQIGSLIGETKYYWRTAAINSLSQVGSYSPWQQFVTGIFLPGTPTPVSPADGVTLNGNTATFTWNTSSNNARTYRLQLSLVNTFATLLYDNASITDTTVSVDTLKHCDQYFWRVSATNPAGTTAFSTTRKFNSETGIPLPPAPTAPANLDTIRTAQATLSWESTDLCSERFIVILLVDTASAAVLRRDTVSVTSEQIGSLSGETKYFWKIASINSLSQAGSYTPWQQFITGIFLPGTPTLVSPANGVTLGANTVTFTWNKSANNARTYRLQVSIVNTFSSLVVDNASISDTTFSIDTIKHCDQYFWRVSATNPVGTTAFSTSRNFNSEQAVPLPPTPVSPANGADHIDETPLLAWVPNDSCANKYILEVSGDSAAFNNHIIEKDTVTGWSRTLTAHLASSSINYWRVTAMNGLGGGVSGIVHFTVTPLTTPDIPNLLLPLTGTQNSTLRPTLVWNKAKRATTYRLQVSNNVNFTTTIVGNTSLSDTSLEVGPFAASKIFYWRVNATNIVGTSNWSDTLNFTTLSPPVPPTPIDPPDNASFLDVTPSFTWSISPMAVSYTIDVATDFSFREKVFTDSNLTTTSIQIPSENKLIGRTVYYWRVRSKNEAGFGNFSVSRQFKTSPTGIPKWLMSVSVAETGPAHDSVYFGVNNSATFGLDPNLDEYELPPPTFGQFDARFINLNSHPGMLGQGIRVDVEPFFNYQQSDTFHLKIRLGTGSYPIRLGWHNDVFPQICDSIILSYTDTGNVVHDRIDKKVSYIISNPEISSAYIIVFGTFPTGVDDRHQPGTAQEIPKGYQLYQNYPNPFNPATMISFSTERTAQVQLGVYDVLGREIAILANGTFSPGLYTMQWNGKNSTGAQMPSGVYYARIIMNGQSAGPGNADHYMFTRKMLMLK